MTPSAKPRLGADILRELHQLSHLKSLVRFCVFTALYLAGLFAALALAAEFSWLAAVPCWVLSGAALHGISLFTHEAVHGTLSRNRWLNGILGALCAWPVWQNFSAYKVLHLDHHADLGGEHDPDHYSNYSRWTWGVFALNWIRLIIGYPIYLIAIPVLGWKHGSWRARAGLTLEIAGCALLSWLAWQTFPISFLLHAWLGPMAFINVMVNIRGMSQHTLLDQADDEILGTRSILTGPLVRFFMCNENYHLEHHLYPGIPWYQLPATHHLLEPELRRRGATFISSYTAFVRHFVQHSFTRGPWSRTP